MNKIKKYCEISPTRRVKTLDIIKSIDYNGKWQVSEKIHGSNTVMYVPLDGEAYYSSRNELISSNQSHFNYTTVFKEIAPNIDRLIENCKNIFGHDFNYHTIAVYGEIFGGCYNHADVPKVQNAMRVQKGVYYSPKNEFLAFDVAVLRDRSQDEIDNIKNSIDEWKKKRSEETDATKIASIDNTINSLYAKLESPFSRYLDYADFVKALENTNIRSVPLIGIYDTLDEALNVSPIFESKVYELFDLPKIDNNFAEGLVIKPVKEMYFGDGKRVILKNKNPKFDEIIGNDRKKVDKIEPTYSDDVKELIAKIAEYSNINRLNNVISKLSGPFTAKDFGRILKEFNVDVISDLEKDCDELINKVKSNDEYKIFTKKVSDINSLLLKSEIVNIIDA